MAYCMFAEAAMTSLSFSSPWQPDREKNMPIRIGMQHNFKILCLDNQKYLEDVLTIQSVVSGERYLYTNPARTAPKIGATQNSHS